MPFSLPAGMRLVSPDTDTFSTPPMSPAVPVLDHNITSLSRRNSRPSSLHLDQSQLQDSFKPDIQVTSSPDYSTIATHMSHDQPPKRPPPSPNTSHHQAPKSSPCLVHSHLDKNINLGNWLKNKPNNLYTNGEVGVAKSLQQASPSLGHLQPNYFAGGDADNDDEYISSLTTRLAETAVDVREMSKQLGRARVQSNIQNVLIVTKARDNRLIKLTRELALYLMLKRKPGQQRGLVVYVDSQLRNSRRFDAEGIKRDHPELFVPFPRRRSSSSHSVHSSDSNGADEGQLRYWTSSMCSRSPHLFDFVVTLGGDGTVLFTSWLFQKIVPPVLSFALGSLGFLTNFDFADHQAVMDSAIDNGIRVNLRMRFTCTVYRAVAQEKGKGRKAVKKAETGEIIMKNLEKGGGWEALEGGWSGGMAMGEGKCSKDKEIMCYTTRPVESFEVLNDLVVDRGPSPYVSQLELFGDDHHMTTVQADGLTISTPTGSTAYSLSAGGSLVHPEIPAILITPICPHTLSFRPMLLPDSMELRISVPYNSRSTAWASFDGRGRVELKQGDHIKVTASRYPFPTVCADKQSTDWFHAISRTLKWNERERQKSFVVVEEDPLKPRRRKRSRTAGVSGDRTATTAAADAGAATGSAQNTDGEGGVLSDDEEDYDEEEEEEEEEDKFDIDDSSAAEDKATDSEVLEETAKQRERERAYNERKRRAKSRSKSRPRHGHSPSSASTTSTTYSGVDSPSRYASGRAPHGPHGHGLDGVNHSLRQVEFENGHQNNGYSNGAHGHVNGQPGGGGGGGGGYGYHNGGGEYAGASGGPASTDPSPTSQPELLHEHGTRDDIHTQKSPSARSRIPKDRDISNLTSPSVETPRTATQHAHGRGRGYSRGEGGGTHRAFAVWGHDESDSNASDSDL